MLSARRRLRALRQHLAVPVGSSEQPRPVEAAHPVLPPEPRLEGLLRPEALAAFDRERFESDGYWLWAGALTDEGRARMTAELQRLQAASRGRVCH